MMLNHLFILASVSMAQPSADGELTYWRDIRPLFRQHCIACHARRYQDDREKSGGIVLDSPDALTSVGKDAILAPGKSAESRLYRALSAKDDSKRMPLGAVPLPRESIDLVRRWIDTGAKAGTKPTAEVVSKTTMRAGRKLPIALKIDVSIPNGVAQAKLGKLEVRLLVGPLAPVTAVALSPDGTKLAVGSQFHVVLWDLTTLAQPRFLPDAFPTVHDLKFSHDSKWLAIAGGQPAASGEIRVIQVSDGKTIADLRGHEDVVYGVSFHPKESKLASASFDKTVRVWDIPSGRCDRIQKGHSDFVYAVAYSPDGHQLASCSKDRSIKVVESTTGIGKFTMGGMEQDITTLAYSRDGERLLSSGLEPALVWWNAQTGQRIRSQGGHGISVQEVGISIDGTMAASAGMDKSVRLWNGQTGAGVRSLPLPSPVYSVALSSDAKWVAAGCADGLVRLIDTSNPKRMLSLCSSGQEWLVHTADGYLHVSPDWAKVMQWTVADKTIPSEFCLERLHQSSLVREYFKSGKTPSPKWTR